ncbi:hypothetical protein JJD41_01025 [Oxynema sp. CENA135]|uniref:hypothetical protein n=1 Tax=Oxynema sp. CENA135 TaxID=984206 RepID=UPI00190BEB7A|nr:hypothetical protein [Oxynema sp. CENA135]
MKPLKFAKIKWLDRSSFKKLVFPIAILFFISFGGWATVLNIPGKSYRGELPPLTAYEADLARLLRRDIETICGDLGEHNYLVYDRLIEVERFLESSLSAAGYTVNRHSYQVDGQVFNNLEVEI